MNRRLPHSNPWLAAHRPRPQRQVRLFCFPYAGGSAAAYRRWPELMPEDIEVCPVELPGRGHRFSEPARLQLEGLTAEIHAGLAPMLGEPYALFGHSLGAMVAFEFARRLTAAGDPLPVRLFVSGQRAPHRPDPKPPLHDLPDGAFLEEIRALGGTPPDIFANPELMELFLPILRADFQMGETFVWVPSGPLPVPLSALGGLEDDQVSLEDLAGWQAYTRADFRIRRFPGDHFFLCQSESQVVVAIVEQLRDRVCSAGQRVSRHTSNSSRSSSPAAGAAVDDD